MSERQPAGMLSIMRLGQPVPVFEPHLEGTFSPAEMQDLPKVDFLLVEGENIKYVVMATDAIHGRLLRLVGIPTVMESENGFVTPLYSLEHSGCAELACVFRCISFCAVMF